MNLPNKLSIIRIVLVPIMMFFYLADFIPYGIGKYLAAIIFLIAAFTDRLDGKIARERNQVTDLGKLLDPIADKMLLTCGLLLIVVDHTIMAPLGIIGLAILIARDTLVNALRQIGTTKGIVFAAPLSGKLKAIFHYIYIPIFMVLAGFTAVGVTGLIWTTLFKIFEVRAYFVFGVATAITIWSAIDYSIRNKKLFSQQEENKQEPVSETEENKLEKQED